MGLRYRTADVRVRSDTELVFHRTRLELVSGTVYVDTGATEGVAVPIMIETPLGSISHVGTQFVISVSDDALVFAVREGTRVLRTDWARRNLSARPGESAIARVTKGRQLEVSFEPLLSARWQWIAEATPGFAVGGRSTDDALVWAAREAGMQLHHAWALPAGSVLARLPWASPGGIVDAFNLKWPGGDATLYTDGVRCRVVWRPRNGMGGAIENTELAKRRVAGGLHFAPSLLDELRGHGYADLASAVEAQAGALPQPVSVVQAESGAKRIAQWLAQLDGSAAFERCGTRRALKWYQGRSWPEPLSLKAPAKTGKHEWVVKIGGEGYYQADDFAGVCACLASLDDFATSEFFDAFFEGTKGLRHKEVTAARDAWATGGK